MENHKTHTHESFWKGAFLNSLVFTYEPGDTDIKKWDDEPGGKVVDRIVVDGVEYVYVEFENSPGKRYLFRA